jgi:nitroreductase
MAMAAPNRLNRQPWHFFVIRDQELQKKLANALALHPYLESAPVVIAIGAKPELSTTWRMDVMAAIENMMVAATSMGLGTAVVANPDSTTWQTAEEMLSEALHIPPQRGVRIPALVSVGYPAEERPPHGEERFDPTKVHYGVWEERELQVEA